VYKKVSNNVCCVLVILFSCSRGEVKKTASVWLYAARTYQQMYVLTFINLVDAYIKCRLYKSFYIISDIIFKYIYIDNKLN